MEINTQGLKDRFALLGAELHVRQYPRFKWAGRSHIYHTIDVISDKHGEYFDLCFHNDPGEEVEAVIPCLDKRLRHLILFIKLNGSSSQYLCGHDERHWFAATLPRNAANIRHAFQLLKPEPVQIAQEIKKVPSKRINKRRNEIFQRQGEWFFIPAPQIDAVDPRKLIVYENEPLIRGRGKPHMAQQLCRIGGVTVYVNSDNPGGLTEEEYQRYCLKNPGDHRHGFKIMTRGAAVYVRGAVRHHDHRTVHLDSWHQVFTNNEKMSPEMLFLD